MVIQCSTEVIFIKLYLLYYHTLLILNKKTHLLIVYLLYGITAATNTEGLENIYHSECSSDVMCHKNSFCQKNSFFLAAAGLINKTWEHSNSMLYINTHLELLSLPFARILHTSYTSYCEILRMPWSVFCTLLHCTSLNIIYCVFSYLYYHFLLSIYLS